MIFKYLKQPPRRYMFEQHLLRDFVEGWCKGKVLNLFAGKVKLSVDEVRIDLSNEFNPDYNIDALDFIKSTDLKFDTVIYDPPYSLRKSMTKYNGKIASSSLWIKEELPRVLNKEARIITLGYDSVGMSESRGFKKIALYLVCHGGAHHDTICLVEEHNLESELMRR